MALAWANLAAAYCLPDQFSDHQKIVLLLELPFDQLWLLQSVSVCEKRYEIS